MAHTSIPMLLKGGMSPGSSPGEGFDKERLRGILASLEAAAARQQRDHNDTSILSLPEETPIPSTDLLSEPTPIGIAVVEPTQTLVPPVKLGVSPGAIAVPEELDILPSQQHAPGSDAISTSQQLDNQSFGAGDSHNTKKVETELFKVKICRAWQQGKCIYGPRCIYAHAHSELRTRDINAQLIRKLLHKDERCKVDPNKYKVRLCEKFQQFGHCPYNPHCMFAHGEEELRSISYNREIARRVAVLLNTPNSGIGVNEENPEATFVSEAEEQT